MTPQRKQQIESTLQRAISRVLARRLSDPRIRGLVSVTHVNTSPDVRDASVYVSVLPQRYEKRTLAGLRHAAGYIHGALIKAVSLRVVPRLDFRLDETLKRQAAVFEDITKATADRNPQPTP